MLHATFVRLLCFCLVFSLNSFASIPLPEFLHSTLLCESMLRTQKWVPGNDPLSELTRFRKIFSRFPETEERASIFASYTFSVTNLSNMSDDDVRNLNKIRSRLSHDKAALGRLPPESHAIGVAYRGVDQIQKANRIFRIELSKAVQAIRTRSIDAFEKTSGTQFNYILKRAAMGGLVALIFANLESGPSALLAGASFTAFLFGVDVASKRTWVDYVVSDFREHLEGIDYSLSKPFLPFYSVASSRPVLVPNRIHHEFVRNGDQELSETAIQQLLLIDSRPYKPIRAESLEQIHQREMKKVIRTEPEETKRLLSLNSYYFWDAESQEPVWILVYRATPMR